MEPSGIGPKALVGPSEQQPSLVEPGRGDPNRGPRGDSYMARDPSVAPDPSLARASSVSREPSAIVAREPSAVAAPGGVDPFENLETPFDERDSIPFVEYGTFVDDEEPVWETFEEPVNGPPSFSAAYAPQDDFEPALTAREPTEIFSQVSTVNKVTFRALAEVVADDGTFVDVQTREVTFVDDKNYTELSPDSTISYTGLDSTLPMAFDNERFFDSDNGYQDLLNQALKEIKRLVNQKEAWGEPRKEMGWFGSLWRWFVRVLMSWTIDPVNRLRYTRGLQIQLPFEAGYESFVTGGVVRVFDEEDRSADAFNMKRAFSNRNTSRILIQNLRRWDWFWHLGTQVTNSRLFDFLSFLPFLDLFGFPGTENNPASKNHALQGIFRPVFEGSWITRYLTGQESIVTFDKLTEAQNLSAESNGFEASNRNQYGTYFGREKTNEFRFQHRLPTDESIVRTFITRPASTMVNNGVEHVLRRLAAHWRNMLFEENGNFAHQRFEQLEPFEILRFHMPVVLTVLANLRGRNVWDMTTLGPFIKKLQYLDPSRTKRRAAGEADLEENDIDLAEIQGPCLAAKGLVNELKEKIIPNVCGGVPSRVEPFVRWADAILDAITALNIEAERVREFVASVDTGIALGYQLLKLVDWYVPSRKYLSSAVVDHILNKSTSHDDVPREVIISALQKLAPKDERTLRELVVQGQMSTDAAQLLVRRTSTLLERELRRKALDDRIRGLSRGPASTAADLERNKWYLLDTDGRSVIVLFKGLYGGKIKVLDVETQREELHDVNEVLIRQYIPVAEAISRAQKAFMTIELDYGKKFSYNTFMEFGSVVRPSSLRTRLRRLVAVAQIFCSELDKARLNVLSEVKLSVQKVRKSHKFAASRLVAECKPQNVTVLGGGPTGLMCAVHCVHNVLMTGGEVKIYEGRDTFDQEASSFERAQIVRLDPRQIAMLRYHLGTGFEDVFISATGETDPHLGNNLPGEGGFVELTIKRFESMMLDEIINLRSKGLLHFYSDSKIQFDALSGTFDKKGSVLKVDDRVYNPDASGGKQEIMVVEGFTYKTCVNASELVEGHDYDIVLPRDKKARKFRLQKAQPTYDYYQFAPHEPGVEEVTGGFGNLPPVYLSVEGRLDPTGIIFAVNGKKKELSYDSVRNKGFRLDFSHTHVVLAIGKPDASPVHFYVTTAEPHAVCCIEGIKVSKGMHNFGEKRWGSGIIDDIRSHTDQNTRIVGDFTKSTVVPKIVDRMRHKLLHDAVWKAHLNNLPNSVKENVPSLHTLVLGKMEELCTTTFRRQRRQTRFFELGNNYYLGMELTREYDDWKNSLVAEIAPEKPATAPESAKKVRNKFRNILPHHIDRLWYEATLEIIAEGDVYNPGGRSKLPTLYMIDSPFEQTLGELKDLDSFRWFTKKFRVHKQEGTGLCHIQSEQERQSFAIPSTTYVFDLNLESTRELSALSAGDLFEPIDTFEILSKGFRTSLVRNSRGFVTRMSNTVPVVRSSDLARAPNGYSESKVALAAFPVAHVVCHRTLWVNRVEGKGGDDGFITAYIGDAQTSPHFMRYSGLTGACINGMLVNNLVGQALSGVRVQDRIQLFSFATHWSNSEVITRGTGANYGEDGFLRPGFPYDALVDYLYARAHEHFDMGASTDVILSRDWKIKLAAAIVPRGLENDTLFYEALVKTIESVLRAKFDKELKRALGVMELSAALRNAVAMEIADCMKQWGFNQNSSSSTDGSGMLDRQGRALEHTSMLVKSVNRALKQTFDYSVELRQGNARLSSELFNQPKPVDIIVDDFAVEMQNFANGLAESAAFAAGNISLSLLDQDSSVNRAAPVVGALLGVRNIGLAFGSMTNVSRYKNRNEQMRTKICDEKMPKILKAVFSLMTKDQRDQVPFEQNPFLKGINDLANYFVADARYYNQDEDKIKYFEDVYGRFKLSTKGQLATFEFIRTLVQKLIPDTFHVNSYLQADLVNIYKALDEMLDLLKKSGSKGVPGASELFQKLQAFVPKLEKTLERGDIRYGFLREHRFSQTSVPVTLKYLFGPCLGSFDIANETKSLLKAIKAIERPGITDKTLKRPIRDLTELYHATNESRVASMMFLSAFIVFCFSIFFSFFLLLEFCVAPGEDRDTGWVGDVLAQSTWAALGSVLGSSLATFHFVRKLRHLFAVDDALGGRKSDPRIQLIRAVTKIQQFLVLLRLLAVVAALVALPWIIHNANLANGNWNPVLDDPPDPDIPVYIAVVAVCTALLAAIIFFLVEFFVRYSLPPALGQVVCEPFQDEIADIKRSFTKYDSEQIETSQKLESEAWEYTAREFLSRYRFDTVFAANRFGTILQHLQSGNKGKSE